MRSSTQILPGIKAVGWVDCRNLPTHVALHGITQNRVGIFTDVNYIEFFGEPDCRCTSEKENGNYTDKAALKFVCAEELPKSIPLAFVVTDIAGESFLIGAKEKPYPQIKINRVFGLADGVAAGYEYEVTHVAIKSMVPCKI